MSSLDRAAPAKLNLHLRVLAREDSGFHQLESLFCLLELADGLHVRRAGPGIQLEVEGADLGPPEDNLVYRAAVAFYSATGRTASVAIRLSKNIPAAAGFGGGSSDAAATLHALNELEGAPLEEPALLGLAASIGSDVPFFAARMPLALAWGRGERLLPLPALPASPVLLAVPAFASPTAEAYRDLDRVRAHAPTGCTAPRPDILRFDQLRSWEQVARFAANDFEVPLFRRFPILAAVREALAEAGASPARLTGTGSAVFGVFSDPARAAAAALSLQRRFPEIRVIETATAG